MSRKNTERVTLLLPPEEFDKLKTNADSLGMPLSTYVRYLVIKDNNEKK